MSSTLAKEVVLPISSIKEVFFVRAKLNEDHALHLAELIEAGVKLPPIEVASEGEDTILVDGRHRLHAYWAVLDRKSVPVVFVKGTREELLLRAMRANTGGSLTTAGADINLVIKQFIAMSVSKTKIIQQMSMPNFPFTAALIRRHLETVYHQLTRDQLISAQRAVIEGMATPDAARQYNVPLGRLQTALGGVKKKKTAAADLGNVLTKTAHSRSRVISNTITKAFEMFDDGELRASQLQKLLDHVEHLNKRFVKLHRNWVVRFEERKKLVQAEK